MNYMVYPQRCTKTRWTHYARAFDNRGRELTKKVFTFNNDIEGFNSFYHRKLMLIPPGKILVRRCY